MLCVADYLDSLEWVKSIGGLPATIERCNRNLGVIENFVATHEWISFLAKEPETRSNTSVCLAVDLAPESVKSMAAMLAEENVAYDIGAYRDAPAGLRIWCGATVEQGDLLKLMPWLEWAYLTVKGHK
jgi:phosphoserine aminotransferase